MLAMTKDMVLPDGYPVELRLARLHVPLASQPALARLSRLAMGAVVGALPGAAAGHAAFWLITGAALGAMLDAVIRRT